jgi:hypothetical protein
VLAAIGIDGAGDMTIGHSVSEQPDPRRARHDSAVGEAVVARNANRNARKHGGHSGETIALRRHITELARTARRLVETV